MGKTRLSQSLAIAMEVSEAVSVHQEVAQRQRLALALLNKMLETVSTQVMAITATAQVVCPETIRIKTFN